MICTAADCTDQGTRRGLCNRHYKRWQKHGSTETVLLSNQREIPAASRLAQRSEQQGECLIYTAGTSSRSGHVKIGYQGKRMDVHRVAWLLAHGPIPDGLVVRHRCDTPRCIDLVHLELGTVADNNRDRDERGRHVSLPAEANGMAKLANVDIPAIKAAVESGRTQRLVAADYGVSQRTVWNIVHGHAYGSVTATGGAA